MPQFWTDELDLLAADEAFALITQPDRSFRLQPHRSRNIDEALVFAKEHPHLNSPGCEIEVHEAQQIRNVGAQGSGREAVFGRAAVALQD